MLQILMTASILMVRDIDSPHTRSTTGLLLLCLKIRNKLIYNASPPKDKQKNHRHTQNKTPLLV